MQDPNNKLDISAISFDDMLGDGLQAVQEEVEEPVVEAEEQVEEPEEEVEEQVVDEELEEAPEVDEEVEEEVPEVTASVASEIAGTLGFELDNEYADTVEGLTEFVRDLSQEAAEDQISSLFEQYPEVQKHLDYLMSGGSSEAFFEAYNPQTDFDNIEVAENDVQMQKAVLSQYFAAKGHDQEFIQEIIETYEDNGKLYSKATIAKDEIAEAQKVYREQLLQEQQQKFEAEVEQNEKFWESVADTIESGNEFAGIRIPDKQKSKFFDYISEPVGPNGETQRDLDYEESDINVKLAIDYLMYNGFNLNDIIDTKARTKSAESLRNRIVSNQERVKSARKTQRRTNTFDPEDLDINALLQ
jgi:hypothetical protein